MSSKPILKKAKEAIANKDYAKALEACQMLMMFDSKNYTGMIYLGVAQFNLGKVEESEATYQKAIALDPVQPLAFQGLLTLYEKTDQKDKLLDAYQQARNVYSVNNNDSKVVELTVKIADLIASEPSQVVLRIKTLKSLLPGGDYHSNVSRSGEAVSPLSLLQTIAPLEFERDQNRILKEIETRRRRLSNDSMDVIRCKVRTEIYQQTEYSDTLEKMMKFKDELSSEEWIAINRQYFAFHLDLILLTYIEDKARILNNLVLQAKSLIAEECKFDLAYEVCLNFDDVNHPDSYNKSLLKTCLDLFPHSRLSTYTSLLISNFKSDSDLICEIEPTQDLLLSSTGVLELNTHMWYRLNKKQPGEALKCSKLLENFLEQFSKNSPKTFINLSESIKICTAFCYLLEGPEFYDMAYDIFQEALARNPLNSLALKGLADCSTKKGCLDVAEKAFSSLLQLDSENAYALSGLAWLYILRGTPDLALSPIQKALEIDNSSAISHFRMGRVYWELGDRFRSEKQFAYAHFLKAAQIDSSLGSPFLYLGYYYQENNDISRSIKCFTKATQLDPTEESFRSLYIIQTSINDTKNVYTTINSAAHRLSNSSWAWGTLGGLQLASGDFFESITSFQTALKLNIKEATYWEGLGEAYLEVGRYTASLKAFQRASQLVSVSLASQYFIARIEMNLGKLIDAVQSIKKLLTYLAENPEDLKIYYIPSMKLYADILYHQAQVAFRTGAYGLMAEHISTGLVVLSEIIKEDPKICAIWELIGDLCLLFRLIPYNIQDLCLSSTDLIVNQLVLITNENKDSTKFSELLNLKQTNNPISFILNLSFFSYKLALMLSHKTENAGLFLYKMGFATYNIYHFLKYYTQDGTREPDILTAHHYLKSALQIIKTSISNDPLNSLAWNLLGVITMNESVEVSQHAFSKASSLDPKNPSPLTNYGFLCLLQGDYELAGLAFSRSQTLQPDFSPSWAGQAILALMSNSPTSYDVVSHTVNLDETVSNQLSLIYPFLIFKNNLMKVEGLDSTSLNNGLFSIQKFVELNPRHASALMLLAIFNERVGCTLPATDALLKAQDSLISQHQAAEALSVSRDILPRIFSNFCSVQIHRGRLLSATGEFNKAVDAYMAAIGCIEHLGGKISEKDTTLLYLGLGSAHFHLNDYESSLKFFESSLSLTNKVPKNKLARKVALQLSQVLWALGSSTHRDIAVQQLLNCIKNQNHTIEVILALAVMGLVKEDSVLTSAAFQELLGVSPHEEDENLEKKLDDTLSQIYSVLGNSQKALSHLNRAILLYPNKYEPYLNLSKFLLGIRDSQNNLTKKVASISKTGLSLAILNGAPAHDIAELYKTQASAYSLGKSQSPKALVYSQKAAYAAPWLCNNIR